MCSARGLWLFYSVGIDLWVTHGCAAVLAAEPIISQLQTTGTISIPCCSPPYLLFLLTTFTSGLFVAGFFMSSSSISSFSHQSPKHHTCTVLAGQWWTLFSLLSQLWLDSLTSSKGWTRRDTKHLRPGPVLMSSLFVLLSTSDWRFSKVFLLSRLNVTDSALL